MALSLRERSFAADKSDIYIDGKNLRAYGCFVTSDGWTIEKTTPSTNYTDVPGVEGGADTTAENVDDAAYLGRRDVTINVAAVGDQGEVLEAKQLVGYLIGRTVELFNLLEGLTLTGRVSVDSWEDIYAAGGKLVGSNTSITFDCEPLATGKTVRVDLKRGTNDVTLKGNRAVRPRCGIYASSGSGSGLYGFKIGSTTMKTNDSFPLSKGCVYDCANRFVYGVAELSSVTSSDTPLNLTFDSDWLQLPAGKFQIVADAPSYIEYEPKYVV